VLTRSKLLDVPNQEQAPALQSHKKEEEEAVTKEELLQIPLLEEERVVSEESLHRHELIQTVLLTSEEDRVVVEDDIQDHLPVLLHEQDEGNLRESVARPTQLRRNRKSLDQGALRPQEERPIHRHPFANQLLPPNHVNPV